MAKQRLTGCIHHSGDDAELDLELDAYCEEMLFRLIDPANRSHRILPLHLRRWQRLQCVEQYPEFIRELLCLLVSDSFGAQKF
jgi:hypothetical protein